MAFTATFTNLTIIQQHYRAICCSELHPKQSRNIEGTGRKSFTPL